MLAIEVRVDGQIDECWSDWFEGLQIQHVEGAQTILSGELQDQAAVYGLLTRLWNYRLPLLSVTVNDKAALEAKPVIDTRGGDQGGGSPCSSQKPGFWMR